MRLADLSYSVRMLWSAKARAFLTTLGRVIGVMSVVAVSSVGRSVEELVLGEITALGTNLVNVLPGGSDDDAPPAKPAKTAPAGAKPDRALNSTAPQGKTGDPDDAGFAPRLPRGGGGDRARVSGV